MPLYVRDEEVAAMAAELRDLLKAGSKTEAVRLALRREIDRQKGGLPLKERVARLQAQADALGPADRDFDQKAYADRMWGDA
ncbi:type II toxin-antitoxin system VapB family antitoxin [Mongoliimonas terrestris]|uniref:type II toxin-antitoxin system VapB family antitoxin n=1 Tax=Mongoliimonas terrestris TaxID=1709001 RepID=UPI0009496E23|nr:type II toxin-antitoxin system VapB family antitoxin [Mongoliimonas terrestris]